MGPANLEYALEKDDQDPLKPFRDRYAFPVSREGNPSIYFCGNSLGLQPYQANYYVKEEMDRWARRAVKGHFEGEPAWVDYQDGLNQILCGITGSEPGEVVIMNTLTVNIHLMLVSFYRPTRDRYKILVEYSPFPSDHYAVKSQIRYHGYAVEDALIELKPRPGEFHMRMEDIEDIIDQHGPSLALVYFGSVNYLNGQAYSLPSLVRKAHSAGAIFGLDLAHGAGNLILKLHEWEVDFAVWCTYKFLNGGPNSLAACFIHQMHHGPQGLPRFEGWYGHDRQRRFLMEPDFLPMSGAAAWQLSGPPILSLAAMRAGLEDFEEAGMQRLRNKSMQLTAFLESLLLSLHDPRLNIITPDNPEMRGCQLSLRLNPPDKRIFHALLDAGIVVDWREPGIIRVAPVPMYNRFQEVYAFYVLLAQILKSG